MQFKHFSHSLDEELKEVCVVGVQLVLEFLEQQDQEIMPVDA